MKKTDQPECPCLIEPMRSTCGNWADNESACGCAEVALAGRLPG